MKIEDQISAVDRLLENFRAWRHHPDALEHQTWLALKEIHRSLSAKTPGEIGKVRLALTDQVGRAKRHYAQFGFYDAGHAMTICQAICGRWFHPITNALEKFEREAVS